MESIELLCGGICFASLGLMPLVAIDRWWEFRRFMHATQGLASERSDTWEISEQLGGCLFLCIGLVMIVLFLTQAT